MISHSLSRPLRLVPLTLVLGVGCVTPATGDDSIVITANPSPLAAGATAQVKVTATTADGRVGTGKVKVTSDIGSLVDGVELDLDSFGTAEAAFSCAPPCSGTAQISAKWLKATASVRVDQVAAVTTQMCTVGTVTSLATPTALDLFGTPAYFANGANLPAGIYRLKNNGGCIRYGTGQNWTCHAYANGDVSWWMVGTSTTDRIVMPPGTIGFERVPGSGDLDVGSFADFAACDAANAALPAKTFTFNGGKLGIFLRDDIYADNSAGGKNPSWTLTKVTVGCP